MVESFAESELGRALSEISSWGLESFRILDQTSPPTADLNLLEGRQITVSCSEAGWKVLDQVGCTSLPLSLSRVDPQRITDSTQANSIEEPREPKSFPTLDDLLLSVSPDFERKRMERLFERLDRVKEERRFVYSDEEEEE
jgi:hypothetical protein